MAVRIFPMTILHKEKPMSSVVSMWNVTRYVMEALAQPYSNTSLTLEIAIMVIIR